jgi:elongation factor P hydroxylase
MITNKLWQTFMFMTSIPELACQSFWCLAGLSSAKNTLIFHSFWYCYDPRQDITMTIVALQLLFENTSRPNANSAQHDYTCQTKSAAAQSVKL